MIYDYNQQRKISPLISAATFANKIPEKSVQTSIPAQPKDKFAPVANMAGPLSDDTQRPTLCARHQAFGFVRKCIASPATQEPNTLASLPAIPSIIFRI